MRKTAETSSNVNGSSRSHSVFKITLEGHSGALKGQSVTSTISLVDLAGSESVDGMDAQRRLEGVAINRSLTALSRSVMCLKNKTISSAF